MGQAKIKKRMGSSRRDESSPDTTASRSTSAAGVAVRGLCEGSALRRVLGYRRFAGAELTVLLLDGKYHLHAECRSALERLGHRVAAMGLPEHPAHVVRDLLWALVEHKPDFVLAINHMGFDDQGMIGGVLETLHIPLAVWYVDSPIFVLRGAPVPARATSTIFLWEKTLVPAMRAMGAEDVHYLPLATDPSRFRPSALDLIRPLGFVGDSMTHARQKWAGKLGHQELKRVRRLKGALLASRQPGGPPVAAEEHAGTTQQSDLLAAATWEATAEYRLGMLRGVADEELHLFGDEGWTKLLPRATYHGPVNYGESLAAVYSSTAVNLNLTSLQMPTAVNQRVFDVPAAGGFVLTDAQEDLFCHFRAGREAVAFRSPDELLDLARYYQGHESERRAIALSARERILAEHTYQHRLARLIGVMAARHGAARAAAAAGAQAQGGS